MNTLQLLAMVVGLVNIIVFIIVLIKLFQNEGALKGILGLICSLYTFIWGWMNASRLGIRNIMLIWTALIILGIILNVAGGAMMGANAPAYP
ncbi:MAG TPA: hypothetical protein VM934_16170 [Pyrinomonadaceae bacterium]|jgi:hypothetical protein|nr:hypothetical protein [Pyrinomonadaceae bacterium]